MAEGALHILPQPDGTTCGPTCLQAVYDYFGDEVPLPEVIGQVAPLPTGGTLAVSLAIHALQRGYQATIYTYNLQVFDPTWLGLPPDQLSDKLHAQAVVKPDPKLAIATASYLRFLALGGRVVHRELDAALLAELLARGTPVMTGLSATYLYGCARELGDKYDDVAGEPVGHFVLLHDYNHGTRTVGVADPLHNNPGFERPRYRVGVDRLIASILLGVVTYDANLLVIRRV